MLKRLWKLLCRFLQIVVLALLVYGFVQTLPIDLAILLAGDTLLYFEVVTAVWLTAQVTRVKWAFAYARLVLRRSVRRVRRRARRFARRIASSRPPSGNGDRPTPAHAWA